MRPVTIEHIPVNKTQFPFPVVVVVELIAGCNLRCIMCPASKLTRPKGRMKVELYKKIIDEISATAPETELWAPIMGEVLILKEGIFDYVEYAKSKGLKNVYLNTNLVLFKEKWIDRLAASGLDKLVIGFDAATKKTYEKIRIGGNFDVVEQHVLLLEKAKKEGKLNTLEIILQFIVQEQNKHEEEMFKKKWANRGFTLKIRHKLGWGTAVETLHLDIPSIKRKIPCPWLMRTMSIHQNGQVAQCDASWDGQFYVGDVSKQSIKEVWMGELYHKREKHINNDFDFLPCKECSDWQCGLSEVYK